VPKRPEKIRCEAKNVRLTTINQASSTDLTEEKRSNLQLRDLLQGAGKGRFEGVQGGRGSLKETSTL
jgi:hypothetical protein